MNKLKIKCVAIKTPSGTIFRGKKRIYFQHPYLVEEILGDKSLDSLEVESVVCHGVRGYLDSNDNFLTREEASIVAKEAGQLSKNVSVPYSMKSIDVIWP